MRVLVPLIAAGLCAVAAAPAVHAQARIAAATPTARTQTTNPATRALPNPAGLRPIYPAGISSGSGAAQSSSPIAQANSPIPAGQAATTTSTFGGTTVVPAELFPTDTGGVATNVLGAGAGAGTPGPSQYLNSGAGGVSAADAARSFFFADANHDGELTRAEARRLSIATMSFEEMDRNYDGVISRFEYDDSLR